MRFLFCLHFVSGPLFSIGIQCGDSQFHNSLPMLLSFARKSFTKYFCYNYILPLRTDTVQSPRDSIRAFRGSGHPTPRPPPCKLRPISRTPHADGNNQVAFSICYNLHAFIAWAGTTRTDLHSMYSMYSIHTATHTYSGRGMKMANIISANTKQTEQRTPTKKPAKRKEERAANKCFSLLLHLHVIQFNVNNYVKCNPGKFTISRIFFRSASLFFNSILFYLIPLRRMHILLIFAFACSRTKIVGRKPEE